MNYFKSLILCLFIFNVQASAKTSSEAQIMKKGRQYYALGKLDRAIKIYSKIPQDSDYWLESLEEQAWSYLRMNKWNKSLAKIKTAMVPAFSAQLRPEPFVLVGYIHFKTCNYSGIFNIIKDFKSRFASRINGLTQISKNKMTPELKLALNTFKTKKLSWEALNNKVNNLPRMFHKDKRLVRLFKGRMYLTQKKRSVRKNTWAIIKRMRQLAKVDLKEIGKVVRQLHILEAEAIQRSHKVKNVRLAKNIKSKDSADVLIFPQTKEVWLDEIDNYRVSHGQCLDKKEKKL